MLASALSVLCANCGGDEPLSRLEAGTMACPWCGLDFDDGFAPPAPRRPLLLKVVVTAGGGTAW